MSVAPSDAPGLVSTIESRDTVYNHTFGGTLVNIGKTNAYNNTETAGLIFDPLGMITCKRVCCLICCGCTCPIKYAGGERTYEYSVKSSCFCCCKKAWMQAHRGSSADVESKKEGAEDVPLAYTQKHAGCCYGGQETWAIGDMEPDGSGGYKKGPLKYGIRNKPSCFKTGCFSGWGPEREACAALTQGNIIMHTMMPIYRNPAGKPEGGGGSYGTRDDWAQRNQVVGAVTVQNIVMPCCCCCAVPSVCPLNTKVEINQDYAATMDDDEKIKLGLFSHASVPMVPVPGANLAPGVLPLPFAWFGLQTLLIVGYAFGYGNTNVEYRFTGLQEAFANGMAETGDLIPRAIDAANSAVAKGKAAVEKGKAMAESAIAEHQDKIDQAKGMIAEGKAKAEEAITEGKAKAGV
jgi:hypothetical protein